MSEFPSVSTLSEMLGLGNTVFRNGLMYLFKLAWNCRTRLPMLIMLGFMIFDIHMQLEINVNIEMRQVDRVQEEETDEEEEDDDDDDDEGDDGDLDNDEVEDSDRSLGGEVEGGENDVPHDVQAVMEILPAIDFLEVPIQTDEDEGIVLLVDDSFVDLSDELD